MGGEKGFVFIQDYHFALLPRMIKEARPDITVAQFWHIPWPNQEIFRVCPWGEEILDGLLGNDLLGFHIRYHCQNFLDTVDRFIESRIDWERFSITRGGKETIVRPFPISTDFEKMEEIAKRPEISQNIINIRKRLGLKDRIIGLGVDRIDYIKGIPERFMAIDRFLERYPEYHRRFVFIQLGPLSRIRIQRYREYNDEIYNLMVEINGKYKKGDWQPIIVHKSHLSLEEIVSYYCLADLCIVSSLHDGMNLVTKEFVASRYDLEATLILSKFTGASRELEDALLINPYATDQFADTIKRALELSVDEKKRRMKAMRELVRERNVYNWACELINEVRRIG
jgi:trehalose 6-phosphate synthase